MTDMDTSQAEPSSRAADERPTGAAESVGSLLGDIKAEVAVASEESREGLAQKLDDVAEAVRNSGEQLEGRQDWIAGVVERGADELRTLAASLRDKDFQGLLGDLEELARRQPAIFVGASMAAGFALVRLGKAALPAAGSRNAAGPAEAQHEGR